MQVSPEGGTGSEEEILGKKILTLLTAHTTHCAARREWFGTKLMYSCISISRGIHAFPFPGVNPLCFNPPLLPNCSQHAAMEGESIPAQINGKKEITQNSFVPTSSL